MKTWNRICIKDYTLTDAIGQTFTVEKAGKVTVLSKYWVDVPAAIFAGEEPFT